MIVPLDVSSSIVDTLCNICCCGCWSCLDVCSTAADTFSMCNKGKSSHRHVCQINIIAGSGDVAQLGIRKVAACGVDWFLTKGGVEQQGHGVGKAPIREPYHCPGLTIKWDEH